MSKLKNGCDLSSLIGQRVRVFFNLQQHCYGIARKVEGQWRVAGYTNHVELSDCHSVVSEAGRQRVIESGEKHVHAWIEGNLESQGKFPTLEKDEQISFWGNCWDNGLVSVSYNPFKRKHIKGFTVYDPEPDETLGYSEHSLMPTGTYVYGYTAIGEFKGRQPIPVMWGKLP